MNNKEVRNVTTFARPFRARLRGQDVTVIAQGDREGSSIVYHYIDGSGMPQEWESAREFQVIDTNILPVNTQAIGMLGQGGGTAEALGSSRSSR